MAYQIDRLVRDSLIQAKSQAVMDAVEAVVLDEHHTQPIRDAHGITIYHIAKDDPQGDEFMYYQTELDFTQQTGWDEFLAAHESD
jgi:metal-responsive CopG/Arc/MetJ family transcriptional regulator